MREYPKLLLLFLLMTSITFATYSPLPKLQKGPNQLTEWHNRPDSDGLATQRVEGSSQWPGLEFQKPSLGHTQQQQTGGKQLVQDPNYLSYPQFKTINGVFKQQKQLIDIPQYHIHLRLLSSTSRNQNRDQSNTQKQDDNNESSGDGQTNIYLIFLLTGSIVLALLFLACCIIFVCKYCLRVRFLNNNQLNPGEGARSGSKVVNLTYAYDYIYPPLKYNIFEKQVGLVLHDSCVICLIDFEEQEQTPYVPKSDLVFNEPDLLNVGVPPRTVNLAHINNVKQNHHSHKATNEQQLPNYTSIGNSRQVNKSIDMNVKVNEKPVKLTVCGHLLHAKCLDEWLVREQNCPLCRQSFSDDNLKIWEVKMGLSIDQLFEKYCIKSKRSKSRFFSIGRNKDSKKNSDKQKKDSTLLKKNNSHSKSNISNRNTETLFELAKSNSRNKNIIDEIQQESYNDQFRRVASMKKRASNERTNTEELNQNAIYTDRQKYAIALYRKVIHYHKGRNINNLITQDKSNEKVQSLQGELHKISENDVEVSPLKINSNNDKLKLFRSTNTQHKCEGSSYRRQEPLANFIYESPKKHKQLEDERPFTHDVSESPKRKSPRKKRKQRTHDWNFGIQAQHFDDLHMDQQSNNDITPKPLP